MKYKQISLPLPNMPPANLRRILTAFNGQFAEDEIRLERHNDGVLINLRELNIRNMRAVVKKLGEASGTTADFLNGVESAVMGVKSYGIRGRRRNYTDFNAERKVKNRADKEKKRGKLSGLHQTKNLHEENLLPQEYCDKIICADSAEFLKTLPDNCVDLVFTSPPYNFGLDYAVSDDDKKWEDYFDKLFAVFAECVRVVKHGGRIAINVQPLYSDYVPSHHIISQFFTARHLIWKGEILWEKNNYNCKYTAWGSWKSPASPYLKYSWEFVEVFCKGALKKDGSQERADITADEFKKWVYGKWSIAPERDMKRFGHPAMFPEELARRVLKLFSFRGDVVLDPFNGAGTTTLAAIKNDRHYLGVDISREYCDVAEKRIIDLSTPLVG